MGRHRCSLNARLQSRPLIKPGTAARKWTSCWAAFDVQLLSASECLNVNGISHLNAGLYQLSVPHTKHKFDRVGKLLRNYNQSSLQNI